ncbi:MAG: Flp pilus assembly complex ATPase component TadA [Ruminiclostridium sp.]|nr:Flp pilus assembly complex ATPase component TadA [Ruminiclostridium sp.]
MADNGKDFIDSIVELGYADKTKLLPLLAQAEGEEYLDLTDYVIAESWVPKLLGEKISRKFDMLALEKDDSTDTLVVAMKDPKNIFAIDSAHLMTSLTIQPVMVDELLLRAKLDLVFAVEKPEPVAQMAPASDEKPKHATTPETAALFREKIGQILLAEGEITDAQLIKALDIQRETGTVIGSILMQEGFITRDQLYKHLEQQIGVPYVNLEDIVIPEEVVALVNRKIAIKYHLVPLNCDDEILTVAMADPLNMFAIDDLRLATGHEIKPMLADSEQIEQLIPVYFKEPEIIPEPIIEEVEEPVPTINFEEEMEKVKEEIDVEVQKKEVETSINLSDVDNAPIVRMLNMIFKNAIDKGASDIHIEAYEDCVMVRFRIDGQLVEVMKQDKKLQQILVARVKIISGLNIAEKRLPQDGRIALKINNRNYDFRVSVLPTMFGEKVVIRIADKEGFNKTKHDLGFTDEDLAKFDKILSNPHGIVLVTGPTGSGKSTTLYCALRELSKPTVNILTVEDPVEATVRGINQVQVNTKAGMTFPNALRSFLRQDPDIIMVGEIRDGETAEIAIRAAITGHLVLSTLHTNDSISSINRLIDMGVEPFLIASSLVGVVAQRLVRRLCPNCKEEYTVTEREAKILKSDKDAKLFKPVGCPACNGTGYKGRIAVYEIVTITDDLRELISANASVGKLKEVALKGGMKTLAANCAQFVLSGVTSLEEMLSVVAVRD